MKKYNLKTIPKKELEKLYRTGMFYKRMANYFKCSVSKISYNLKKYEIPRIGSSKRLRNRKRSKKSVKKQIKTSLKNLIKKLNYCKDCGKQIKLQRKRCKKCHLRFQRSRVEYKNPNYKNAKKYCKDCGKFIGYVKTKKRCVRCENIHRRGSNSVHWKGGISKLPYPFEFNKELKSTILERDNYTCQLCREHPCADLTVHHIDYNKQNCKKENLTTLCRSCNVRVNYNREHWRVYFERKIKEKQRIEN
jgi:hypothetical protein